MLSTLRDSIKSALYGGSADKTEADEHAKWVMEFQGAERFSKTWRDKGDKVVKAYLGEHTQAISDSKTRLNLFYSNIVTIKAMMYAKLPKVETDRRFLDPDDDVARVAAEMMERVLSNDMSQADDTFSDVIKEALQDRLLPGLGAVRVKYGMEEQDDPAGTLDPETGEVVKVKKDEWTEFVYTYWDDILWSPARTKTEVRWIAFRAYMTKEEVEARWGEEVAKLIQYTSKGPDFKDSKSTSLTDIPNRNQAEIWEIWDKDAKQVLWLSKTYTKILDRKDDPLGLPEFFPCEELVANLTSSKYLPKADYVIAQDLYEEIDSLQTRITHLTEAAKLVGVYDQSNKEVARMFNEGVENTLIPVNNWAMLADKGGLKGVIDWLPVKDVVEAINTLQAQLQQRIQVLYQVVGMSDIMRGQATGPVASATEQKIKAQAASNRIQSLQDEFALFVSNLLNKKAWIVQKFYSPEQIIRLSNIANTPDAQFAEAAIQMIKGPEFNLRVVVRADTMAQKDLAEIRESRSQYLQAIAQWVGQTQGMIQADPDSYPFLLQLLRFGLAAFESANEMESVIDRFSAQVEKKIAAKNSQPPPPSPEQQKMQGQMQLEQMKQQADMQAKQVDQQMEGQKMQAEMAMEQQRFQLEVQKMQMEMQMQREEHQLKMQMMQAELQFKAQDAQIKQQSAVQQAQIKASSAQQQAEIQAESAEAEQERAGEAHEQDLEFRKQEAKVSAKESGDGK
jgi:hypothetical protein